ncbi:hypothetical protein C8J56DRAFT_1059876 [Mycena floridula]|nr:hypothetical protein C8J56DRAFT_1059876 [Mycena floridula]
MVIFADRDTTASNPGSPSHPSVVNYISLGSSLWMTPSPSTPQRQRNIGLGPDFVPLIASLGGSQSSVSDSDYVSLEDIYDLNLGYWLHCYLDAFEEREAFVHGMKKHGVHQDHASFLWDMYTAARDLPFA